MKANFDSSSLLNLQNLLPVVDRGSTKLRVTLPMIAVLIFFEWDTKLADFTVKPIAYKVVNSPRKEKGIYSQGAGLPRGAGSSTVTNLRTSCSFIF